MLQESITVGGAGVAFQEVAVCALNEIHYGQSTIARRRAYDLMRDLLRLPDTRALMDKFGHLGGVIEVLAQQIRDG